MNVRIDPTWKSELDQEWKKPYFEELTEYVRGEYRNPAVTVYPPAAKYLRHLTNARSIR